MRKGKRRAFVSQCAPGATLLTPGTVYCLLLVARDAYSSLAASARIAVEELVIQRIWARAKSLIELIEVEESAASVELVRLVDSAVPQVLSALQSYRPRTPQQVLPWLDRRIDVALRGEPLESLPVTEISVGTAMALQHLLRHRDHQRGILMLILRELPATERGVITCRSAPHTTWARVAEMMGLTVSAARALHRRALANARARLMSSSEEKVPQDGGGDSRRVA